MKIAITGHTSGIGKAFAEYLYDRGHEIVGLSKRHGNNIRNTPKIVEQIVDCDMFINNAQAGFSQTELFLAVADQWSENRDKMIWNISTAMTQDQVIFKVPGLSTRELVEYRTQKRALEDAVNSMRDESKCRIVIIRPGSVATEDYKTPGIDSADVDAWCKAVCDFYIECRKNKLYPLEISLGFKSEAPEI